MGISTEMLVCEDMTTCTDLTHRHVVDEIATDPPLSEGAGLQTR